MSERLTDEELGQYAVARCLCNGCVPPDARDAGVRSMARELIERRAASSTTVILADDSGGVRLSADEVKALAFAAELVKASPVWGREYNDRKDLALAALDKLLATAVRK